MERDLQVQYTYFPRMHEREETHTAHQAILYSVEQQDGLVVAKGAVGELFHQQLVRRVTKTDTIIPLRVRLPEGYSHQEAIIRASWPHRIDYYDSAFITLQEFERNEAETKLPSSCDLLQKIGIALLAAAKLSSEAEAVRGKNEEYSDIVTQEAIDSVYEAERKMHVIIHKRPTIEL